MSRPVRTLAGLLTAGLVLATAAPTAEAARVEPRPAERATSRPLTGLTIALDPGHQLGNHRFPRATQRLVPSGGFKKPCNTTGTATNRGYAEATVNWQVALLIRARLTALGAKVALTRGSNSESAWGPCVNARGAFGKRVGAALMVSLHADGAPGSAHGFHVIAPSRRAPWTSDIATPSLALARDLRVGMLRWKIPRSTYVRGALAVRSDLGTLNMSDVPVAMVEIGNMRNRADARRMTSLAGRVTYSNGLVNGIRRYLHR